VGGEVTPEQRLRTPGELTAALRSLRADVAAGRLEQYFDPDALLGTEKTLGEIPLEGPWDDYLELFFRDPRTGERYQLTAETYHGQGGAFERLG
jgi:hypothetical protein